MIYLWGLTLLSIFLLSIVALGISFLLFNFLGDLLGAPFVPTSGKILDEILKKAKLKKGQVFIELGSGDGRVVTEATKKYNLMGIGVEFNPILVWYSRLIAKLFMVPNLKFRQENLFKTDLKSADILFYFLTPRTIRKLTPKIIRECKPGTQIISHGFQTAGLSKYLIGSIERKIFTTYYYVLGRPSGKNTSR